MSTPTYTLQDLHDAALAQGHQGELSYGFVMLARRILAELDADCRLEDEDEVQARLPDDDDTRVAPMAASLEHGQALLERWKVVRAHGQSLTRVGTLLQQQGWDPAAGPCESQDGWTGGSLHQHYAWALAPRAAAVSTANSSSSTGAHR